MENQKAIEILKILKGLDISTASLILRRVKDRINLDSIVTVNEEKFKS